MTDWYSAEGHRKGMDLKREQVRARDESTTGGCVCMPPQSRLCEATIYGWLCTREPGHDGPHVACAGAEGHRLHEWGGEP